MNNQRGAFMEQQLFNELKKEYFEHLTELELLITYLDKIDDSGNDKRAEFLEKAQGIVNTLYGYKKSDTLIDVQALINEYRHMYDITDPREICNTENGKGFVQ